MIYEKYLEQFNKIGYAEDRVNLIPNFINSDQLHILNGFIKNSGMSGPINNQKISNQEVINILLDSQNRIYEKIYKYYTSTYGVIFDKNAIIPTHLVKWDVSPGEAMPVHSDCERPDGSPAMHDGYYKYNLAAICYLNDDYDGGEIFFPALNKKIKPTAGDLIMFPGKFRHGVTGVNNGDRHTMLTWFRFDIEDNTLDEDLPYSGTAIGVLFNEETGN